MATSERETLDRAGASVGSSPYLREDAAGDGPFRAEVPAPLCESCRQVEALPYPIDGFRVCAGCAPKPPRCGYCGYVIYAWDERDRFNGVLWHRGCVYAHGEERYETFVTEHADG